MQGRTGPGSDSEVIRRREHRIAAGETLPDLVHLAYGGGRMPVPLIERMLSLLPAVGLVNAYGLTETSSTIAVLGPSSGVRQPGTGDAGPAGLGRPAAAGSRHEIRDPLGRPLPVGQWGEIHVRGEQVAGE
jgi:fatty-acyl-CoA synthase